MTGGTRMINTELDARFARADALVSKLEALTSPLGGAIRDCALALEQLALDSLGDRERARRTPEVIALMKRTSAALQRL